MFSVDLKRMDIPALNKALSILRKEIQKWKVPAVGVIAERAIDRPFETLVSTILSLRTKDAVTEAASHRLLARASTPSPGPAISRQGGRQIELLLVHSKPLSATLTKNTSRSWRPERE